MKKLVPYSRGLHETTTRRAGRGAVMIPVRQKLIGENKVEEWRMPRVFGLDEDYRVYINDREVGEEYDEAVTRLEGEE